MADKVNNSDLIRSALEAGVSKPTDIIAWVKERHDVEVKKSLINNVKQRYKKETGKAKKARRKELAVEAPEILAEASASADGKSQSKLIREALDSGILKPGHVIDWVKSTYGIEVGRGLVNQVKHKWVHSGAKKKGKPGRPRAAAAAASPEAAAPKASAPKDAANGSIISDIVAVKDLIGRIGKEELSKLIEVL